MGLSTLDCIICDKEFDVDEYGESECPSCGQGYEYDEGVFIELTDEQIKLLKDHKNELKTKE
jgi:hypothetical protein